MYYFLLLFLADIPQKRVDRQRSSGSVVAQTPGPGAYRSNAVAQLAEGSPLVARRPLYSNIRYNKDFSFHFLFFLLQII